MAFPFDLGTVWVEATTPVIAPTPALYFLPGTDLTWLYMRYGAIDHIKSHSC